MKNVFFTENTLALNDQVFPASYTIAADSTVHVFVTVIENGEAVNLRIKFAPDHEHHAAALAAALQTVRPEIILEADADERPAFIPAEQAEAQPEAQPEAEETEPTSEPETVAEPEPEEQPERDPKQTRGEVPEKLFAGLEIAGNGWKILFDKTYDRTRVIFKDMPSKAAREACKNAGFYWSPVLQSWNKKLTFKAFRKAQTLAVELRAICG